MRREGRQRGWVRVYDRELVDPEGKRRAVHVVEGMAVANGGFIRASRKPTNQSKPGGRRALGMLARNKTNVEEEEEAQVHTPALAASFGYYSASAGWLSPFRYGDAVMQEEPQAHPPRSGGKTSYKGSHHTFRHDGKKMYCLDEDEFYYLDDFDS